MKAFLLWFLLAPGFVFVAAAQQDSLRQAEEDAERRRPLGDTNRVHFYYLDNPDVLLPIDTGLTDLEYLNPAWKRRYDWGWHDLGNPGSPVLGLVFEPEVRGGFWLGLEQYGRYRLHRNELRYYEISRNLPFTDIYYSQLNQRNALVRVSFAHKITPRFYYTLNYNIINHFGYFDNQQVRNQNIGFSGAYRSERGKYRFYLDLLHNAVKQEENGGVLNDDEVGGLPAAFLVSLDVRSRSARTEYKHTDIHFQQYFYNRSGDSATWSSPSSLEIGHRTSFGTNRYKYFDTAPDTLTGYYGGFEVNPRGMRYFALHHFIENELSYRQALGGSLENAPLWFRAYVVHRINWGQMEPERFVRQQAGAGLRLRSNPRLALRYDADGQVLWNQGMGLDFWARGRLGYDFKKFGMLQAYGLFERYSPSENANRWHINRQAVWSNNFRQIQVFTLQGGYVWEGLPWLRLEAGFANHTLTNWVYCDTTGRPVQASASVNLLQVPLRFGLKLWKFGLEGEGVWQRILAGNYFFRLPQFYLVGKLFWEGRLFKTLRLRIGVNLRYWTAYHAPGYLPYTGQFHLQDQKRMEYYPMLDVYLTVRIWRFRFFATGENLSQLFFRRNYFPALHYPNPNFLVRLGVSWRIFD